MSIKTRGMSFLAAAVLSLSIVTGAMAQVTSTGVTLQNDSTGTCAVSVGTATKFGTYKWNGKAYNAVVPTDSTATIALTVTQTIGLDLLGQPLTCDVSVSGTDLVNGDKSIPAEKISVSTGVLGVGLSSPVTLSSTSKVLATNTLGLVPVTLTLSDPGTAAPGDYSGTITFTTSQGS